jgi:hypothetical protein
MAGIFISYRREDSAGHAGRLFDALAEHFGRERVFMDVVGIEPGLDFIDAIDKAVSSAEVMVAVIGRNWLSCKDGGGQSRLCDPRDFIRLETEAALKRGIRVVPVLVQGAPMPSETDLQDDLKPLARRQAVELSDSRWESDTRRFIKILEGMTSQGRKKKFLLWAVAGVSALVLAGLAAWQFRPVPAPQTTGTSRVEASASHGTPGDLAASEGSAKSGRAMFSPERLDYAQQAVASKGESRNVTITNRGAGKLDIGVTIIEGNAMGDYAIVRNECLGTTLQPGKECVIGVDFQPTAAGNRAAQLTLRGYSMELLGEIGLAGTGQTQTAGARPARILHFIYANGQLCYGVENARSTRIDPVPGAVQSMTKECVAYKPETTRTLTLVATGDDGKDVQRQLTVKADKPDGGKLKSPRCTEILLRAQIGAPLSAADQELLRKECK